MENEDSKSYEYDSDYDSKGNYIWGEEGVDWEFYYEEDKIAYESGLPYEPHDLLNKKQIVTD